MPSFTEQLAECAYLIKCLPTEKQAHLMKKLEEYSHVSYSYSKVDTRSCYTWEQRREADYINYTREEQAGNAVMYVPYDFIENLVKDLALFVREEMVPVFKQLYQDSLNLFNQEHIGGEERSFLFYFAHKHSLYHGVSNEIITLLSSKPLFYGYAELFKSLRELKKHFQELSASITGLQQTQQMGQALIVIRTQYAPLYKECNSYISSEYDYNELCTQLISKEKERYNACKDASQFYSTIKDELIKLGNQAQETIPKLLIMHEEKRAESIRQKKAWLALSPEERAQIEKERTETLRLHKLEQQRLQAEQLAKQEQLAAERAKQAKLKAEEEHRWAEEKKIRDEAEKRHRQIKEKQYAQERKFQEVEQMGLAVILLKRALFQYNAQPELNLFRRSYYAKELQQDKTYIEKLNEAIHPFEILPEQSSYEEKKNAYTKIHLLLKELFNTGAYEDFSLTSFILFHLAIYLSQQYSEYATKENRKALANTFINRDIPHLANECVRTIKPIDETNLPSELDLSRRYNPVFEAYSFHRFKNVVRVFYELPPLYELNKETIYLLRLPSRHTYDSDRGELSAYYHRYRKWEFAKSWPRAFNLQDTPKDSNGYVDESLIEELIGSTISIKIPEIFKEVIDSHLIHLKYSAQSSSFFALPFSQPQINQEHLIRLKKLATNSIKGPEHLEQFIISLSECFSLYSFAKHSFNSNIVLKLCKPYYSVRYQENDERYNCEEGRKEIALWFLELLKNPYNIFSRTQQEPLDAKALKAAQEKEASFFKIF